MKFIKKRLLIFSFFLFLFSSAIAQQYKPFWFEIAAFKKADSIHFPPQHAILFTGSSSFRKCTDVSNYFPGYTIINRGFGGSTIPDVTIYVNDIIYPYHPKQVVIYCGDNDLASSDTITAKIVEKRFEELFKKIRKKLPLTSILFVSIKPSPSRRNLMPQIEDVNKMIKMYLAKNKYTAFADVYHPMLDKSGQPKPEIFLSDSLHMNSKGYDIWQKVLKPYLIKN